MARRKKTFWNTYWKFLPFILALALIAQGINLQMKGITHVEWYNGKTRKVDEMPTAVLFVFALPLFLLSLPGVGKKKRVEKQPRATARKP